MEPSRFIIGTAQWNKYDKDTVPEFLDFCLSQGINTIDTGYQYGGEPHYVEELLKPEIKRLGRDKVHIIDKLPMYMSVIKDQPLESIFQSQCDALGVDYIDTYLLHCPLEDPSISYRELEIFIKFIEKLKEEGRVKNIGFSAHVTFPEATYLMDLASWDYVMFAYNVLTSPVAKLYPNISVWKNPGREGFEYAKKLNYKTISMMPFEGGRALNITADSTFKEYCASFVKNESLIDHITLGSRNTKHIKEFLCQ